jgi:hypothetical protein
LVDLLEYIESTLASQITTTMRVMMGVRENLKNQFSTSFKERIKIYINCMKKKSLTLGIMRLIAALSTDDALKNNTLVKLSNKCYYAGLHFLLS